MHKTEEKQKSSKYGKIVEEPKGLQPTRPLTSYIFFSNEELPKVVTAQKLPHKEAMKVVGQMWGALSEEQKAPYFKKYENDKLR
jgi:HMG (high mobility group) box